MNEEQIRNNANTLKTFPSQKEINAQEDEAESRELISSNEIDIKPETVFDPNE